MYIINFYIKIIKFFKLITYFLYIKKIHIILNKNYINCSEIFDKYILNIGKIIMKKLNSEYQIELFHKHATYFDNPTKIFYKLCKNRSSTLLLESNEIKNKKNIKSFMIVDSALRISSNNKKVKLQAFSNNGESLLLLLDKKLPKTIKNFKTFNTRKLIFPKVKNFIDEDSRLCSLSTFDCLRLLTKLVENPMNSKTAMFFGGLFSYDLISEFENLPLIKNNSKCPHYCFYLSELLVIIDHKKKSCKLQSSLFKNNLSEKKRLKKRLHNIKNIINNISNKIYCKNFNKVTPNCNLNDEEYKRIILNVKKFIYLGEIFQIVISRKFFLPCPFPLASYHALKISNPSPYMFFMQDKNFILFGASPESSLKYDSKTRKIEVYPIAGTRARARKKDGSINLDLDSRIELEMRFNKKELSEHLMLVDLARNDLAKICEPGSRYASDLIKVDRYSHVMHLVSRIIGKLRSNLDVFHAYRACMNMGTLTGAPKVKAMQIIAQQENEKRGSYGGSIGYFTNQGSLDMCIIIRSAYIEKNIATVQAGAGIVLESIPQLEADESRNKAQAVLHAIYNTYSYREHF